MKILAIENCSDCPYFITGGYRGSYGDECSHPKSGWGKYTSGKGIPKWCPLKDPPKVNQLKN